MTRSVHTFFAVFLILAFCLSLFGCSNDVVVLDTTQPAAQPEETAAPSPSTISPALYLVTDQEGHRLWLFGSIHVGTKDFYPLPDYVMDAYRSSDALAVEIDIIAVEADILGQMELLKQLMYADGSSISQHIPAETYEKAVAILQENQLYSPALDLCLPVMWWSSIENLTYEKAGGLTEYGIDLNLLQMAKKDQKTILEVESAEQQYGMMAGFSQPLQVMLLQSAVESYENLPQTTEDLQAMLAMWSSGDVNAFAEYLQEEEYFENKTEELLYQEYTEKLVTERNLSMTQYAEEALVSGQEVFLCVGAAHIIGEGAIAENLRQLGYTVELIP